MKWKTKILILLVYAGYTYSFEKQSLLITLKGNSEIFVIITQNVFQIIHFSLS